ncbi:hypothetical protein C500_15425 [Natrialba magadii ATCC 43099]|uniref:Uncharacterized protein n=1 Tax=Natrialba magadii (strain ATCC 43099 / DSM 3394 / CCM 3739 / CIP 104546 / IAM 13178 / JCM 8861 / NBRC 102185 / NCIMB 2190 / MS3) TaxID=547559 RepID=L9UPE7_NATMM|nr:hypothetical protein C500_15425 [Natrialba magadii ATCC 43099]
MIMSSHWKQLASRPVATPSVSGPHLFLAMHELYRPLLMVDHACVDCLRVKWFEMPSMSHQQAKPKVSRTLLNIDAM